MRSTHAMTYNTNNDDTWSRSQEIDLHQKLLFEIHTRYGVECNLASEMAWDLLEMMTALDANPETLDKYFLN